MISTEDLFFLDRAADLAAEADVQETRPNPRVGCVLVRDGRRLGEGFHKKLGGPHAEIEALNEACAGGLNTKGATAYVTLEPCAHVGRTPPCASALVAAGVERVVFGCEDPNPQVNGRGLDILRAASVRVESASHEPSRALTRTFRYWITTGMPWIEAKVAISHDGFVATADGKRTDLTGEVSRCFVHRRRNMHDAVAVGGQTVRTDLPRLDARFGDPSRTPPAAVIFSISGEMTWDAPLFHVPGRDVFLVTGYESAEKLSVPRGVHLVIAKTVTESYGPRLDMEDALRHLAAADLRSLYVEPGPALLRSLQPYINELFVIEGDRSLHSGKPWAPDTLQALYRKRPYMEQGCDVVWKMEKIDVYGNY